MKDLWNAWILFLDFLVLLILVFFSSCYCLFLLFFRYVAQYWNAALWKRARALNPQIKFIFKVVLHLS